VADTYQFGCYPGNSFQDRLSGGRLTKLSQQRNKPKEPPKAPEKAPFFLPTLPGVETRFEVAAKENEANKKPTRRIEQAAARDESLFLKNLANEEPEGDCT
jgi:U3 small nucleolar RNA-associated protein 21